MTQLAGTRAVFAPLLVFSGALFWGTAGPASQFLYSTTATSPMAVAFLRLALAAPLLLLFAMPALREHAGALRNRASVLLTGGLCIALYQVFYFQAVAVSGVTLATLTALCPVPVLVAVLARIILGERDAPVPWLGIILASIGTLLLVGTPDTNAPTSELLLGAMLGLLASLAFSGIALTGRALGHTIPPLAVTTTFFLVGALALAPTILFIPQAVMATFDAPWIVAFLVLFPTVIAYGLFYSGAGYTPAAITGVLIVAEPLTASILGWALLDERLASLQLAGAALLCAAMIRAALQQRNGT